MGKKKVEVIDISLSIDVAEEIRSKVDSLSNDVIEHTKEVIKKSGVKIQRVSKKKQEAKEKLERVDTAIEFLESSFEVPDRWVEAKEILELVGMEVSAQNMNKLSMQIRKILEKEDKWTLSKKRRKGKTVYRLTQFS